LVAAVWDKVVSVWDGSTSCDLAERCAKAAEAASTTLMTGALAQQTAAAPLALFRLLGGLPTYKTAIHSACEATYTAVRADLFQNAPQRTPAYLGRASSLLYTFVRRTLNVPFHRGIVEHPLQPVAEGQSSRKPDERRTIGHDVSVIYAAIRDGTLFGAVVKGAKEAAER